MQLANKIFFAYVEEMLAEGREVQLLVKGYSMRPLLRSERDTVVLAPYRGECLQVSDVVLFRYRNRHVLHRIVHIHGDRLTLEGDGNYRLQERCTTADVVAVVQRIIRPSGRVIACQSWRWHLVSRTWRMLPPLARRYLLAALYRTGIR